MNLATHRPGIFPYLQVPENPYFCGLCVFMTDMQEMIRAFPEQLTLALEPLNGLKTNGNTIRNIVVAGMGGSAFGAEVLRNLIAPTCAVPFSIVRDYELPAFVGPDTLLIVSSYSGDTEETLAALETATARNPRVVAITSGGKLTRLAEENGYDLLPVPGGLPPRKAAGYSIGRQLQLLMHLGFAPDLRSEIEEAIALLRGFSDHALAREIAAAIHAHLPVIYSSATMDSAALRWRQEIEENAKQFTTHHSIPEMNHNELVGWALPADLLSKSAVVILRSAYDHPRTLRRMELNASIIAPRAASLTFVDAKGKSRVAQLLWLLHLGDWTSWYLAGLNGVDPVPVQVINHLKAEMEKTN